MSCMHQRFYKRGHPSQVTGTHYMASGWSVGRVGRSYHQLLGVTLVTSPALLEAHLIISPSSLGGWPINQTQLLVSQLFSILPCPFTTLRHDTTTTTITLIIHLPSVRRVSDTLFDIHSLAFSLSREAYLLSGCLTRACVCLRFAWEVCIRRRGRL